jgi:hypothetical protein
MHEDINNKISTLDAFKKTKYFSQKYTSYFPIYDQLFGRFQGTSLTFVEVGVLHGGSLFMFRDFFGKKARIIGIDNNKSALQFSDDFEIFIGDQSDPLFWDNFFKTVGPIDILLDDGGHKNVQQIQTVVSTLPYVRDGGLIVIEDTHTSFMYEFGNPNKKSFINWAALKAKNLTKRHSFVNNADNLVSRVSQVSFFDSLVSFYISSETSLIGKSIVNSGKKTTSSDNRNTDLPAISKYLRVVRSACRKPVAILKKIIFMRLVFKYLVSLIFRIESRIVTRHLNKYF